MHDKVKKITDAAYMIEKAYSVKSRALSVKPNILTLLYALVHDEKLSQSKLHGEWMIPLSTINTITTECRDSGYITLEPIPGKRRECYLHFTPKGKQFADKILTAIQLAEEEALQETLQRYSPEFVEAMEFYAKTFHNILNNNENE